MKYLFVFVNIIMITCIIAKESPGFFIKVSKNIPRLGRRADVVDKNRFLLNNLIDQDPLYNDSTDEERFWNSPTTTKTKQIPKFADGKLYNNVQPYDSTYFLTTNINDQSGNQDLKFISWQDFDRALDNDRGLFEKLISLHRQEYNKHPDLFNKMAIYKVMSAMENNVI